MLGRSLLPCWYFNLLISDSDQCLSYLARRDLGPKELLHSPMGRRQHWR